MYTSAHADSDRQLIIWAEELAQAHHAKYDSSHDYLHVDRVRKGAVAIARSINNSSTSSNNSSEVVDEVVVTLAALFHDLIDSKYLPPGTKITAQERLEEFWSEWQEDDDISDARVRLVEKIVDNVSYSKEVKRLQAGEETDWHKTCLEFHCVSDADRLDAIGAFGILRCAAYSGVSHVPLYVSPSTSLSTTIHRRVFHKISAMDHFTDKLVKLEEMMRTEKGKELAKERTSFLYLFMEQIDREWKELEGGI